jgi:excisionase family DNA binding protein
MSRGRKNPPSVGHAHDGEPPLGRVADVDRHTIEHPSDPSTRPSTGRRKWAAKTEPPNNLPHLPLPQRLRPSARENKPRPLLSIHDVAEILNTSWKTVRRRIREGALRASRIGGVWRIDPADLEDFIRDRRSR